MTRLLWAGGGSLWALAWLGWLARETAVAVVVDLELVAVVAMLTCTGLAAIVWLSRRSTGRAIVLAASGISALVVMTGRWIVIVCEAVSFSSPEASLGGTWCRPRWGDDLPAAVFVHGSGPQSRDESMFFARYLARRGIAALAYDKRGVGETTGETYGATYEGYGADAVAAATFLARQPAVDPERVGLVGFSEAEWVAPIAAVQSDRIRWLVVVGGCGCTPAEQVEEELRLRLARAGFAAGDVARGTTLAGRVAAYLRGDEPDPAELEAQLRRARNEAWFAAAEDLPAELPRVEEYAWWIRVMDFDAAPLWREVDVPVLLLKGADDDRSAAAPAMDRMRGALGAGSAPPPTVQILPAADHMLLQWPLGRDRPPPRFAPGYPELLATWIHGRP